MWDKNSLSPNPDQAAPLCVSQDSHFPPQFLVFMEELLGFRLAWHVSELAPAGLTRLKCVTNVGIFLILDRCFIQRSESRVLRTPFRRHAATRRKETELM